MATLLYGSTLLAQSNRRCPSATTRASTSLTNTAVGYQASQITQGQSQAPALLDPFTSYKTYLETHAPLLGEQEDFESENEDLTCHSDTAVVHDDPACNAQLQPINHSVGYKLAARLANRSNGLPLATIIEQGSYSTLHSHGSLLSVGQFPSLRTAENTSPNRWSRRRSHSLDEKALNNTQEDTIIKHDLPTVAVPHVRLPKGHEAASTSSGTATPLTAYRFELQQSPASQSRDVVLDHDNHRVRGFIRGVLHNVRGVSRTRSRSSSRTQAPIMEHRESPPSTRDSSPQPDLQGQNSSFSHPHRYDCNISSFPSRGAVTPPAPGDRTRNRATSSSGVELSARAHLSVSQSRSSGVNSSTVFDSMPSAMPCRVATRSHELPSFSNLTARPTIRGVAQDQGSIQILASTGHELFEISTRYKNDGAHLGCSPSLKEANSAKEVFTNPNVSFCSTMSTSYSGTVLGIDLDLQHDFSHQTRRSQSPLTPVWFTPQMAELELQALDPGSPNSVDTCGFTHALGTSITSSALTSLLPIAAASGIVQPNYNTPKISFYSPSGNLIQPESSSPQQTSPSDYERSPTTSTFNYHKQTSKSSASSEDLPIRPPLLPTTNSCLPTARVPPHLQHHHNTKYLEQSQSSSCESCIMPKGTVKGCDGIVRENSLSPRSGVFNPRRKGRNHRPPKLVVHDLKAEAKFYKARFIGLVAAQSFAPSMPKGRTLQKRNASEYNTYTRKSHRHSSYTQKARKCGFMHEGFAPFTAHALRVCFCQPFDGAGMSTCPTATGTFLAGETVRSKGEYHADHSTKDAECSLPNARVASSGRRSECGGVKRRTKGNATRLTTDCARTK